VDRSTSSGVIELGARKTTLFPSELLLHFVFTRRICRLRHRWGADELVEFITGMHGVVEKSIRVVYVLKRGSSVVVYDAKYKGKVVLRDVTTLLAYIAEYARPVRLGCEKVLVGGFYKLQDPARREVEPVVRNKALNTKIAIYIYTLDPRIHEDSVKMTIE
jgi:hypothetical protein